jgi:excisionase family DNA binding protein
MSKAEHTIGRNASERPAASTQWMTRRDIEAVEGALQPAAYVQRAYLHARQHGGRPPGWARKTDGGRWLFDPDYIRSDAADNLATFSVGEAAEMLGATRRAVQNWIDKGEIKILGGTHDKGHARRILKEPFLRSLNRLKRRLETPAVVGRKLKEGHPVAPSVLEKLGTQKRAADVESAQTRLAAGIRAAKQRSAAALEEHLSAAKAARSRKLKRGTDEQAVKESSATAVESRLAAAREAKRNRKAIEAVAVEVAERIINDMFDERLSRIQAMIIFNRIMDAQKVPRDIRIKVRKRFFGR